VVGKQAIVDPFRRLDVEDTDETSDEQPE